MNKSNWQKKMVPEEVQELEAARRVKDEGNDHYKVVRRRIKARCDARLRREAERMKGED